MTILEGKWISKKIKKDTTKCRSFQIDEVKKIKDIFYIKFPFIMDISFVILYKSQQHLTPCASPRGYNYLEISLKIFIIRGRYCQPPPKKKSSVPESYTVMLLCDIHILPGVAWLVIYIFYVFDRFYHEILFCCKRFITREWDMLKRDSQTLYQYP